MAGQAARRRVKKSDEHTSKKFVNDLVKPQNADMNT